MVRSDVKGQPAKVRVAGATVSSNPPSETATWAGALSRLGEQLRNIHRAQEQRAELARRRARLVLSRVVEAVRGLPGLSLRERLARIDALRSRLWAATEEPGWLVKELEEALRELEGRVEEAA